MRRYAGRAAYLGLFTAFAVLLGYVEAILPISPGIPGMKLGIANLAVVFVLYRYGAGEAALISLLRVGIIGLLFGNLFSTLFSLAGALTSVLVMTVFRRWLHFGIPGVSIAGGVAHNLAQLAAAVFLVENLQVAAFLPPLLVSGTVTGFLIGIAVCEVAKRVPESLRIPPGS